MASKVFLILCVFIFWLGPTLFIVQHGGSSKSAYAAAYLALPWLLVGPFFWGFLNFYSGVGLAFLAACNHVRLSRLSKAGTGQLILHAAFVVLLYFWHLASLGIYLVVASCQVIDGWLRAGRDHRVAAILKSGPLMASIAPACLVMVGVMLSPKLSPLSGGIVWSTPKEKLSHLVGYFMAYSPLLNSAVLLAWFAAAAVMFSWRQMRIQQPNFVHLAAASFALLYLILPVDSGPRRARTSEWCRRCW